MAMPPPGFSREQFYELSQRQQTPGAGGAGVGGGAVPQCWQRPGMAANSRQAPYQGQLEQQQQQQQQRQLQHQRQQQQLQQQQQQIRGGSTPVNPVYAYSMALQKDPSRSSPLPPPPAAAPQTPSSTMMQAMHSPVQNVMGDYGQQLAAQQQQQKYIPGLNNPPTPPPPAAAATVAPLAPTAAVGRLQVEPQSAPQPSPAAVSVGEQPQSQDDSPTCLTPDGPAPLITSVLPRKKAPKKVPPELIEGFLTGTKNPVSALMEYSAMVRLNTTFDETTVEAPSVTSRFAYVCTIDGTAYPQGCGKTKKEAKTNSAKIAFTMLLGVDEDDIDDENETGTVIYDSMGRKIVLPKNDFIGESVPNEGGPGELASKLAQQAPAPVTGLAGVLNSNTFGALNRNPVSVLQEYCQKKRIPFCIEVSDVAGPEGFTAVVSINDQNVASANATNKKDAKREACDVAMRILLATDQPDHDILHDDEDATHFDRVAGNSHAQLHKLLVCVPEYLAGRKVLATFVVKRGKDDKGEVVALGTGNTCITGDNMALDGRTLNDCHAEVVARRALLRYFHQEIRSFYEGNLVHSIFEEQQGSTLLKLKDYVSIHMYISTAPCGDGALFAPRDTVQLGEEELKQIESGVHFPTFSNEKHGVLRTKVEQDYFGSVDRPSFGEGTIPVEKSMSPLQTWDGIMRGERLRTMSCSDKILRWNVLGLQGALFGQYIEPVYISSFTLGYLFDHGHLARAICCRVSDEIKVKLPDNYTLYHPHLGRVTMYEPSRDTQKTKTVSCNWTLGDDLVEINDGRTGKTTERSPFKTGATGASRLCKAAFLHRFREIARMSKRFQLLEARNYHDVKIQNLPYQEAKKVFVESLENAGYGRWIEKPAEQELFAK